MLFRSQIGPLAAHGAVLKHAARCERSVERATGAATDRPEGLLRDAIDAGMMTEQEFVDLVGRASIEVAPVGSLADEDEASMASAKQRAIEELLEKGPVLLHVDARYAGVAVPERLRSDPRLVLRFGYRLTPPIADLSIAAAGVAGTLTFNGRRFPCGLPGRSIYAAMIAGEQMGGVWPEDGPQDATGSDPREGGHAEIPSPMAPAGDKAGPPPAGTAPRARRPSHLKLVE